VLHAAARVVQEMGKSRAAAHALGVYDEGARLHSYSESIDSIDTSDLESSQSEGVSFPLLSLFLYFYAVLFILCKQCVQSTIDRKFN
jgi:hypothetical protein